MLNLSLFIWRLVARQGSRSSGSCHPLESFHFSMLVYACKINRKLDSGVNLWLIMIAFTIIIADHQSRYNLIRVFILDMDNINLSLQSTTVKEKNLLEL